MTSKKWQPRLSINCITAWTSTTYAAINSWSHWRFFQCCLLQNMGKHSTPEDGICGGRMFVQGKELDLNSARPFQMSWVYSVKSSIFLGSAANYDSASSCIISSTWSGSCSPMAPLLWTILGSPEHLQIWRSLWGKSKKNMASRPKVSSTCDIDPNVPCLG